MERTHRRLDPDWLNARRADPETRVILMSGLEVLVSATDQPCAEILSIERLGEPLPEEALFLGEHEGAALFACPSDLKARSFAGLLCAAGQAAAKILC